MTWICPSCKRKFKNKNQSHSCVQRTAEDIFKHKSNRLQEIYDIIHKELIALDNVQISFVQNAIIISSKSTFLAIKPKREWLDIEFLLDKEIDEFPVYKTARVSKNRIAHFIRVGDKSEVDAQLIGWLKDAYHTVNR